MKRRRPAIPKVPVFTSDGAGRRVKSFISLGMPVVQTSGDPRSKKVCCTSTPINATDASFTNSVDAGTVDSLLVILWALLA